ncbi:TonB-dependent receptor plug domain-containing protein [Brevundimonas sp.]|uniref:TonB-dependent receptor plug domain-containing protein n=1 Tax=Brevundimonas sp. TaxID=1871086 RepID=UPI002E11210A|nr:TonB-dependent receptor plug domain-containing protein [Brevundimonas sp.]
MRIKLFMGAALAPLAIATAVQAQEAQGPVTAVEDVIVTGRPVLRNRTDDTAPTLSYDREYFQRFEPLTVGDALKRVPSVTFLSDVLESDGARLRGLDPGYTKILIDGEEVPGAGVDRSFFVDRIPAELIERVEVVRSSSANRSGDAVAGTVNIVLRDALSLDGGYVRLGAIMFPDSEYGEWGGTYGRSGADRPWAAACFWAPTSRTAATPRTSTRSAMTNRAARSRTPRCRPTCATAPTTPSMRPTPRTWPAASSNWPASSCAPTGIRTKTRSNTAAGSRPTPTC